MPSHTRGMLTVLSLCSFLPFAAGAVGLGELRVTSPLGERFRAEIPVRSPSSSINAGCFHLSTSSPDAMDDTPWLSEVHIALMPDPARLVITSRKPVFDPVVQLAIYTGCGTYLTRHYVALLSPPKLVRDLPVVARSSEVREETSLQPEKPALKPPRAVPGTPKRGGRTALPGETAADMARRLFPHHATAQKHFVRRMVALNPEWLTSAAGDELLPEGVDLHYPQPPARRPVAARPAAPAKTAAVEAKSEKTLETQKKEGTQEKSEIQPEKKPEKEATDRLVLSPSESLSGEPVSVPPTAGEINKRIGDVERQIDTMRAQLNALRAEYPVPPVAIQTLLAEMETRLLAVELNVARISLVNLSTEKPTVATVAAPAEEIKVAASEKVVPAPAAFPEPKLVPVVAPVTTEKVPTPGVDIGVILLGIFGLGVGLSVVLYRQSKRRVGVSNSEENVAIVMASVREAAGEVPEPAQLARGVVDLSDPQTVHELTDEAAGKSGPPRVTDDVEELEQPVELANIMIVYGQVQSAIEVLRNFVEAHPRESLRSSLRLLELFKQTDLRNEFEALADHLPARFNVERPHWEGIQVPPVGTDLPPEDRDTGRPADLIAMLPPHVQGQVVGLWGTRNCLDLLRGLLLDNRGGSRKGFSLAQTQAILKLVKLVESDIR